MENLLSFLSDFRLPEGGVTHSMAFSSLMGRAALSICHRRSRTIACGRRSNLVKTAWDNCAKLLLLQWVSSGETSFLEQRWVRVASCAVKVHHIATLCTVFIIKTGKSESELETFRSTLVSCAVLSNANVEGWAFFLKMPSHRHVPSSLSSSMWPLVVWKQAWDPESRKY